MSSTVSESGSDKILFQKKSVERDNYELDDTEFVKMYDRTTAKSLDKTHNSGINDSSSLAPQQGNRKWKVGDQCMAPYEADGKWYPAQIEEISVGKKACTVSYTGYEQKAILKLEDLLAETEVSANYSRFQHQSTDCTSNWSQYFRSLQTLSISEQMPPAKRRRLSIKQPLNLNLKQRKVSMKRRNVSSPDLCGFFKVPDIPQHILEGKRGPLWGESERRDCWHENFYGKRPKVAQPNSTNYFAYLRFLFRAVPPIGTRQINSMYKRSIAAADQFFGSSAPFSTGVTDSLAVFLFETKLNSQANIMHTSSTDYSKIPNLASENSSTVNLYLEGIRESLKSEIESDVEAAEDAADQEAEETSGATKVADSAKKDTFPIPDLCPPPPPSMFGKIAVAGTEKEALTNMLMSWYMSGYHTGFYQGVMHAKTSQQKPK